MGGLFARANATELVCGHNHVKCVWNTKELRRHMINAFGKKRLGIIFCSTIA